MENIFFLLFLIVAVVIATVVAVFEKRKKDEFDFMASRCSKYVKGTVSQIQQTKDNACLPIFTINEEGKTYDLPYYRHAEQNEFIIGREYELFVDDEKLLIAMTDSDRTYKNDNTSMELRIFVAGFFFCGYLIYRLMNINPELASAMIVFTVGASFYLVADIMGKRETRRNEQNTYITDATIVGFKVDHDDDGDSYFPVYKYTYGGIEYTATSDMSMSGPNEYRQNQVVRIALDPSHSIRRP